jgi:hypothetical protein
MLVRYMALKFAVAVIPHALPGILVALPGGRRPGR